MAYSRSGRKRGFDIGACSLPSTLVLDAVFIRQDLKKELRSEISGNFRDAILGLCQTSPEFDANQLRKAMKVIDTALASNRLLISLFKCY